MNANVKPMPIHALGELAGSLALRITEDFPTWAAPGATGMRAYAIPRGGIPAALAVASVLNLGAIPNSPTLDLVDDPGLADVFIDDIVDSGRTRTQWLDRYPGRLFYTLVDKTRADAPSGWVVFPWEANALGSFEDNVVRLLQFVGEDPARGGLLETPARVTKAWQEWTAGYDQDPSEVLKVFEDGAKDCDEMVVVEGIPVYSHCEHHLAAIFGTATVAYIPNGKIVGLSKLPRLVNIFARRLQVQERMTNQIAQALMEHLQPLGCGVVIKARHMCMESRGIRQAGSYTTTSALLGVFRESASVRSEFLSLARNGK